MSELALRLIEENKKTRATFLDLGNCGLTEVPAEIGELVWLEGLSFSYEWKEGNDWKKTLNIGSANNIKRLTTHVYNSRLSLWSVTEINPFDYLLNLKWLWIGGNFGKKFFLSDLTPLSSLSNLQLLSVELTNVSDISPLEKLVNLKTLYISFTSIDDLSPLKKVTNLQYLFAGQTEVADLSPVANLINLHTIDVSETKISDLSSLKGLVRLQELYLGGTRIVDLQRF